MSLSLRDMMARARSAVGDIAPDAAARILVYCTKGPGARSLLAGETLVTMGFERVETLSGGLVAWSEAGLPVEGSAAPVASS